jgi:DNA-binding transcriptional LysR family regulator
MNIKQLEVFVFIASSGSFSKGAEAACVTQSTVSQHISALEDLCGVRLFDRTGRGAILTEAGKVMFLHAQQVLKSVKETEQAILQFRQADGVELCVGGSTIPGTYLLPKAIANLRKSAAGIIVKVDIGDSSEILDKLNEETIEIGIVGTPTENARFTSIAFGHDEILLVARKGHHWCGRTDIAPQELLKEPMILRGSGSGTNDVVDAALRQHGIKTSDLAVCATLSSSEAVKQAVLADCGVAFVSKMAVRQELKQKTLVKIELPGLTISRSFSLVQRKGRTLSPAAEAFFQVLKLLKM